MLAKVTERFSKMKILIVTIPLRDSPDRSIPYGALTIMNYVRKHGYGDVALYHIDDLRPTFDEAIKYITDYKPDVLGISAIVSTAYEFTKSLSLEVKNKLPDTLIALGGNMGASAEVLLRKTGTEIVVIGEGEKAFLNVVRRSETTHEPSEFSDIKGLAILDGEGEFVNTGYEVPLQADEIWDYDIRDLAQATDIKEVFKRAFIEDAPVAQWIANDPRSQAPHRRNKTIGHIASVKGCVARCTFCHRWDKGIKHISIEKIMKELDQQIEDFNVGYVMIFAETFGNDIKWLKEFCEEIKKRDVLWWSGGMRANAAAATPEWLEIMKDSGCACLTYGNETGSEKMLQIMEKKVSIEDNYNSMEWTIGAGIYTGIQLVIGMPGETSETVEETINYCNFVTTLSPKKDPNYISANYAQALPGTPLYEFGRHKGLIGADLDSEEEYLIMVSNRNARDETTTLNFTEESTLTMRTWRPRITISVNYNFVKTFGIAQYYRAMTSSKDFQNLINKCAGLAGKDRRSIPGLAYLLGHGYFGLAMICHPITFHRLKKLLPLMILIIAARNEGMGRAWRLSSEHVLYRLRRLNRRKVFSHEYKSLRKIVSKDLGALPLDSVEMQPLRDGR